MAAKIGQKKKQPAELGTELPRRQIQLLDIRHGGDLGADCRRPFLVRPPGKPGKSFLLQNRGDRRGTESLVLFAPMPG